MRSREFERWQSHLISSRNVLPDAILFVASFHGLRFVGFSSPLVALLTGSSWVSGPAPGVLGLPANGLLPHRLRQDPRGSACRGRAPRATCARVEPARLMAHVGAGLLARPALEWSPHDPRSTPTRGSSREMRSRRVAPAQPKAHVGAVLLAQHALEWSLHDSNAGWGITTLGARTLDHTRWSPPGSNPQTALRASLCTHARTHA